MKKNGDYVGVDEKYIPEDEKYTEKTVADDIKDDLRQGYSNLKKPENKAKIKKGLNIAKNIGIGYLIFYIIVSVIAVVMFVGITVIIFKQFNHVNNAADDIVDKSSNIINGIIDEGNKETNDKQQNDIKEESDKKMFNNRFEMHSGEKLGYSVKLLLVTVIANNQTEQDHIISLVSGSTNTSDVNEITTFKDSLEDTKKYKISMNYDKNGYVNQVTIVALD